VACGGLDPGPEIGAVGRPIGAPRLVATRTVLAGLNGAASIRQLAEWQRGPPGHGPSSLSCGPGPLLMPVLMRASMVRDFKGGVTTPDWSRVATSTLIELLPDVDDRRLMVNINHRDTEDTEKRDSFQVFLRVPLCLCGSSKE